MPALRKKSPVVEIATLAGVSRAAAYATLNPETSGNIGVAKETRKRILAAAAKIGYVRNELASSLSTGRTNTIGICVQSLKSHFFGGFSSVLDSLAYPEGYSVMIASSEYDSEREQRNIRNFVARRVDAVVVAYSNFEAARDLMLELRGSSKFIYIGDKPCDGLSHAFFDEAAVGRLQAEHLWKTGHRKVMHLNASASSDLNTIIHTQRATYFSTAWNELSGEPPVELQSSNAFYPDHELVSTAAAKLREGELDAIACSADTLAMGMLSALNMLGIKVPADIAVIGVDDLDYSSGFFVPLTTVRLPTDKLASEIWKMLKMHFNGSCEPYGISIQPELIVRNSA